MSLFFWRDTWHPFINHFTTAKWRSWWDFPMLEWPGDGSCAGQCPARAQHQVGAAASPSACAWCPSGRKAGGTATLFSSQDFVCRQEGLFDLTAMGKAAAFRSVWKKVPALAVALIRRAVALKVKGSVRGDPRAFGRGGTPRRTTAWLRSS